MVNIGRETIFEVDAEAFKNDDDYEITVDGTDVGSVTWLDWSYDDLRFTVS